MQVIRLLVIGWLLAPLLRQPVAAQALDPTFTPPSSLYAPGKVYAMAAQQADGKRVLAGDFSRVNNVAVGTLIRLDAAGALDQTFAQNVGLARNTYRAKTLPNGQYLVSSFVNAPVTAGGLTRSALLRLHASGTADATFDAGTGPAVASGNGDMTEVRTFVGQPDGKVLVGGYFTSFNGQAASHLVRLNADGSLDTSFDLGAGFDNGLTTIILQPDGKLLVNGLFRSFNNQAVTGLVRLNTNGSLDTSFNSVIFQGAYIGALVVQPDGKVLATGIVGPAGIVRLLPNGSADTGFTAPSYDPFRYTSGYFDTNVVLQPDGKILLSGSSSASGSYLTRLNTDGTRDAAFVMTNGLSSETYTLGLQADGGVLVGGDFNAFDGRETGLGRLSSTGTADATYLPKLQIAGTVTALLRQPDGQLLVGGNFTEYGGTAVHRVVRLSAAGALDAAFVAATSLLPAKVNALALQPDGKLLAGTSNGLRRLVATGAPDATYGTFAAGSNITALVMQADGRAVVGGNYFPVAPGNTFSYNLVRMTAVGDFDASFVPGSTSTLPLPSAANALLLQPDGKLLVGGQFFTTNGPNQPRVVRYESTGAIDASFDNSVAFTTAPNLPDYTKVVTSLALQPDGKVVVGGSFGMVNGTVRLNLARLSATGLLDTGFVPPATSTGRVAALARQPNGRLLVASLNDLNGTTFGRPITRVLDTGATDPSFGATTTPDNSVLALLVQPDGAIVLGGSFTTIGGQPAGGVARLTAPNVLAVAAPAAGVARTQAWPVPAHSVLHVAPDASAQPRTIELVDALGRAVRTLALTSVATEFALSVDGLPAGLYLLRVTYAAGAVTRPVAVE